ncbi:MAG: hydantoinase/carbamoylase family amidase [Alphaproteobacteria bacterium]|nr:hydantoinase/carbamoylase family amidase [Alphaproteobacteria bacterium]
MPNIDPARLLGDLRRLADFGRYKTGVHRPTYSTEDMAARQWLVDRMGEAGLAATIDGIGTVIGRSASAGPRLLIGSHLETQPYAGWLDGAMGVIYGLEVARAFRDSQDCRNLAIDVGAWADEEGHYGSMLGSRSFCGVLPEQEIDQLSNKMTGKTLRDALAEAGLAGRKREVLPDGRYLGYLEAHVEQGATLDTSGQRLGIVTGIVGIYGYRFTAIGQQNHAGTTRMAARKDAGVALMRLWHDIDQRFAEVTGPHSVWTAGRMVLDPGAPSVIPGKAELLFQFRDIARERLAIMDKALLELVAAADARGPCRIETEVTARTEPRAMDPALQQALERAAEARAPGLHTKLQSGAGHDAQIFAQRLPAGMLFVPSIAGISHHYAEDTKEDDIVLGCQVLADAAASILRGRAGSA